MRGTWYVGWQKGVLFASEFCVRGDSLDLGNIGVVIIVPRAVGLEFTRTLKCHPESVDKTLGRRGFRVAAIDWSPRS